MLSNNQDVISNQPAEMDGIPPPAGTRELRGTSFLE